MGALLGLPLCNRHRHKLQRNKTTLNQNPSKWQLQHKIETELQQIHFIAGGYGKHSSARATRNKSTWCWHQRRANNLLNAQIENIVFNCNDAILMMGASTASSKTIT